MPVVPLMASQVAKVIPRSELVAAHTTMSAEAASNAIRLNVTASDNHRKYLVAVVASVAKQSGWVTEDVANA
jgi:hypothetical protein